MSITKSYSFTIKENMLAKYAKALAHPARISILKLPSQKLMCLCGAKYEEWPLSQSTVPRHLIIKIV
jgi:DNA-binding transcriptional ArsR family regulator